MECAACKANWFVEERLVRPAGLPRSPQHLQLPNQELPEYRYRCVDCGLVYGQEPPKPEVKKKPGRPPKDKTEEG